jgi:hypothetical protein
LAPQKQNYQGQNVKELYALIPIATMLFSVLVIIIHCMLAIAINREAQKLNQAHVRTYGLDPASWTLVVLVSGLAGFGLFWAIHSSALRDHGLFRR